MPKSALVLLAAIAGVGVGCGGSESEDEKAASVTRRYVAAVANGNGSQACSLLTGEARQKLLRSGTALVALAHRGAPPTCAQEINLVRSFLGQDQIAELRKVKVRTEARAGDKATVRISTPTHTTVAPLIKTPAGWRLAGLSVTQPRAPAQTTPVPAPSAPPATGASASPETDLIYQQQLSAGQIRAATINKRLRTLHLTLTDGRHVLATYPRLQFARTLAQLKARGATVVVLSKAQASAEGRGG